MECPICKKEFNEHTGRRPKKFCSDECKVKFWNAFKKVQKGIVENNKPENKKKIEDERNGQSETTEHKNPITPDECVSNPNQEKISELEKELQTVPDVGIGKKRREFLRKQISELKRQTTNH